MTADIYCSVLHNAKPRTCSKCCYSLLFYQMYHFMLNSFAKQNDCNVNSIVLFKSLCILSYSNTAVNTYRHAHTDHPYLIYSQTTNIAAIDIHMFKPSHLNSINCMIVSHFLYFFEVSSFSHHVYPINRTY